MAGKNREQTTFIERDLLDNGRTFSYFQTLRLLNSLASVNGAGSSNRDVYAAGIKISPNLSLGFPGTDVEKIEKDTDKNQYTLTANIPGLYGTSSPLPTFYTEDLFDDMAKGETNTKDFLDVINQRLYELLFAGWSKYRGMQKIFEEKSKSHTDRLFSLIGMGEEALRKEIENPYELLRYTGLFAVGPRSASGLETILSDALGGISINIIQGVERKGIIPEDQRPKLGENIQLGVNSPLGSETQNCSGAFRIEIGPVSDAEYRSLLPGEVHHKKLVSLTELYVSQPLEYELEFIFKESEKPATVCLGGEKWSMLGLDTWIYSEEIKAAAKVEKYSKKQLNEEILPESAAITFETKAEAAAKAVIIEEEEAKIERNKKPVEKIMADKFSSRFYPCIAA